jgi:hypothetical protein
LRAALEDAVAVEEVDAGDVAQTPLESEVVIVEEAAEVGVDEVVGVKVDEELDDEEDIVVVLGSAAVGRVRVDAGVTPVVVVLDPDEAEDAGAATVDFVTVDEDVVEAEEVGDVVVVVVCVAVDGAAADAGEHAAGRRRRRVYCRSG